MPFTDGKYYLASVALAEEIKVRICAVQEVIVRDFDNLSVLRVLFSYFILLRMTSCINVFPLH